MPVKNRQSKICGESAKKKKNYPLKTNKKHKRRETDTLAVQTPIPSTTTLLFLEWKANFFRNGVNESRRPLYSPKKSQKISRKSSEIDNCLYSNGFGIHAQQKLHLQRPKTGKYFTRWIWVCEIGWFWTGLKINEKRNCSYFLRYFRILGPRKDFEPRMRLIGRLVVCWGHSVRDDIRLSSFLFLK